MLNSSRSEGILDSLQREGYLPRLVGVHFATVRGLAELAASENSLQPDGAALTAAEAEELRIAILRIAKWFFDQAQAEGGPQPTENTYVVPDLEVTLEDVYGTIDVDEEAYGGLTSTYIPTRDMVSRWYHCNPDIYTILKDRSDGRVVGYINAMPVFDVIFSSIMAARFSERELGPGDIRRYDIPDMYRLYFCSIALFEDRRTPGNLRRLLDGFLGRLWRLAHQDIYVRDIVTDAVSIAGEQMCVSFGMRPLTRTSRDTPIYHVSLLPPEFRVLTRNGMALREQYAGVYTKLRGIIERSPLP